MLNSTPQPSPIIAPKLICLTAAGLSLPSLTTGTFFFPPAGEELEKDSDVKGEGELSFRMGREGMRKGSERPRAIVTGRARGRRKKDEAGPLVELEMGLIRVGVSMLKAAGRKGEVARRSSMMVPGGGLRCAAVAQLGLYRMVLC
jgi:hypothetical protein